MGVVSCSNFYGTFANLILLTFLAILCDILLNSLSRSNGSYFRNSLYMKVPP